MPSARLDSMIAHLTRLHSPSLSDLDQEITKFTEELPADARLTSTPEITQMEKQAVIESCFKFDTVEEIVSALDAEGSTFSLHCKNKILRASPTAVKITLELFRRSASMALDECLVLEYQLWNMEMVSA